MLQWIRQGRKASGRQRIVTGLLAVALLAWMLGGIAWWRCGVAAACAAPGALREPAVPPLLVSPAVAWYGDRVVARGRMPLRFQPGRPQPRGEHQDFLTELAAQLTGHGDRVLVITSHYVADEDLEVALERGRWALRALQRHGVAPARVLAVPARGARPGLEFRVNHAGQLPVPAPQDLQFVQGGGLALAAETVTGLARLQHELAHDDNLMLRVVARYRPGSDREMAHEYALAAADQLVRMGMPPQRLRIETRETLGPEGVRLFPGDRHAPGGVDIGPDSVQAGAPGR